MDFVGLSLLLIAIIGMLVSAFVVPLIRANTTKEQREYIQLLVNLSVLAAEQLYREPKMGKFKKAYVLSYLNEKDINITDKDLEILIEAAVKELNLAYEGIFSD